MDPQALTIISTGDGVGSDSKVDDSRVVINNSADQKLTVYSDKNSGAISHIIEKTAPSVSAAHSSAPNISLNADGTIIAKDAASRHQLGRKTDVATNSVLKVSSQNIDGTNDKDRFIIDKAGNVFIGDLTEVGNASPTGANIILNANGTIQAGGDANAGVAGTKIFSEGSITVCRNGTDVAFNTKAEGSTTTTSQILADGSASFTGNVDTGVARGIDGTGASLENFGGVRAARPSTQVNPNIANVWEGWLGTDITSAIKADGSVELAGRGTFGSTITCGSTDYSGPYTYLAATEIALNLNSSTSLFKVQSDGTVLIGGTLPSAPNISLNASGSASFAGGGCTIAPEGSITTPTIAFSPLASFYSRVFNSGTCTAIGFTNGDLYLGGTLDGTFVNSQQPNIALNASDGSATFAGSCVFARGVGEITNSTTSDLKVFSIYNSDVGINSFYVQADGSANFGKTTGNVADRNGWLLGSTGYAAGWNKGDGIYTWYAQNDTVNSRLVAFAASTGTNISAAEAVITADGSATFTGKVTAQSFDLESLTALP